MADKTSVLSTKNYDQFQTILGNRLTNYDHIRTLVREITAKNLLATCPIIVNEKMEVIDGQHRLEAAKLLGVPIYYVKVEGLTIKQVVRLNRSQKPWKLGDYLELHVAHKNQNYLLLKEFIEKHHISITNGMIILSSVGYVTADRSKFKEGDWRATTSLEDAEELMALFSRLKPMFYTSVIGRHDSIFSALKRADKRLEDQGYSLVDLVTALEKNNAVIEPYQRVGEFANFFEKQLALQGIIVRLS